MQSLGGIDVKGRTYGWDSYVPADAAIAVVVAGGDDGAGAAVVFAIYGDACHAVRAVVCAKIERSNSSDGGEE